MKVLSVVIILLCLGTSVFADNMESLVIGGPRNFLRDHTNAVINICLDMWDLEDTPENREWIRDGWVKYERIVDGQVYFVYQVFVRQVEATLDEEELEWMYAQLEDNPDCFVELTWNLNGTIASQGLRRKW